MSETRKVPDQMNFFGKNNPASEFAESEAQPTGALLKVLEEIPIDFSKLSKSFHAANMEFMVERGSQYLLTLPQKTAGLALTEAERNKLQDVLRLSRRAEDLFAAIEAKRNHPFQRDDLESIRADHEVMYHDLMDFEKIIQSLKKSQPETAA